MKNLIRACIFGVVASVAAFTAQPAKAAVSPLSFNILPPVQFPPADFSVTGLRISALYGRHRDMYGLDLGLVGNVTEQSFVGLGVSGIFNYTKGQTHAIGLQLAGLANVNTNKTRVYGIQAALGTNYNTAESSVAGLQIALANISRHTNIYGAQVGLYNRANKVYGLQVGLVNETQNLHGIQIGLINFHHQGVVSVCPILNIGF